MMVVDGRRHSGSGTIVRYAVALAALLRRPVRVINARHNRAQPGLRTQHVASVMACAAMCGGAVEGAHVGSREFTFTPGDRIPGGRFEWNIGTAGSTTMLALSVLPVACFAETPVSARIEGGVFQDFAPSPHHLKHVVAPLLRRMGADIDVTVERPGYVPGGAGVIEVTVGRSTRPLRGIDLAEPGRVDQVDGVALASHLADRKVAERMAVACEGRLASASIGADLVQVLDSDARHAGASLAIWSESTTGCLFGADQAGKRGRTAEAIGEFVAEAFLADARSGATVDRHAADQLVLFAALANGRTRYVVPEVNDHVDSNVWLVSEFGANVAVAGKQVAIDGLSLT